MKFNENQLILEKFLWNSNNDFAYEHFNSATGAADILVAAILLSCFLSVSYNNALRWIAGLLNDADQITAITLHNHAHTMIKSMKRLFIWSRSLQIIYRPKPKIIWGEANLLLSCKWEIPLIFVDAFEGFPFPI